MTEARAPESDSATLVQAARALSDLTDGLYFDRKGRGISFLEAGRYDQARTYERVGLTQVGPVTVSTVWLGLNHNWSGGRPVIFETMVLGGDEFHLWTWRYCTLKQAQLGHRRVVRLMRAAQRTPLHLAKPHKTRNRHWR